MRAGSRMRRLAARATLLASVVGCFMSWSVGCSSGSTKSTGVDRITQHRVVCKNMITNCYIAAGTVCNGNYDIISKVDVMKTSGLSDGYREFNVLYHCK